MNSEEAPSRIENNLSIVDVKRNSILAIVECQQMQYFLEKRKWPETGKMRIHDAFPVSKFVIFPDDQFKRKWDLFITLCLLFTAIVTPYRICFVDIDSLEWTLIDGMIDLIFGFDMIVNFLSAYFDLEDSLITDRKQIAKHDFKTWFFIDFISVIPISLILQMNKDYNSLARLARLPRLYRLLKITKLARMFKIAKEKNQVLTYLNEFLKLKVGFERLVYFALIKFVICHITACLWYFVANLNDLDPSTWVVRYGFQDKGNLIFTLFLYFGL